MRFQLVFRKRNAIFNFNPTSLFHFIAFVIYLLISDNFNAWHRQNCHVQSVVLIFRLDALALSVIVTATWLGGWLSHSGIVSKRLNLSENVFDHLKEPSFQFSETPAPIQNYKMNPFSGGVKYTGVGKLAIFVRFSTYIAVYLGNGAR